MVKEGESKLDWMSWERLSKAKKNGGMGFRGFSDFNKALLGKHCCNLSEKGMNIDTMYALPLCKTCLVLITPWNPCPNSYGPEHVDAEVVNL